VNPRQRVRLGRTNVEVDQLALGLVPLGNLYRIVPEDVAQATLQAWWDRGQRTFDVAPVYGIGIAEERLGRFLEGKPRDEFVVSTKVGRPVRRGAPPDPDLTRDDEPLFWGCSPEANPTYEYDRDAILWSLDESLRRLRLDRVDYVHIHDPDRHIPEASKQAFPALAELRAQGVIGAIGTGVNWSWVALAMAHECDLDCVMLAGRYSLLDQEGLRELLPMCERRGISVLDGGVFNGGFVADPRPGAKFQYAPCFDEALIARGQRIKAVCESHGVPIKAAAVQFPMGHPAVAAVVVGAGSARHANEAVDLFEHPVPAAMWQDLLDEGLLPPGTPVPR
jgi:aryl-alcohol dehydrogenase-like predicted oxidoreductase